MYTRRFLWALNPISKDVRTPVGVMRFNILNIRVKQEACPRPGMYFRETSPLNTYIFTKICALLELEKKRKIHLFLDDFIIIIIRVR